MCVSKDKITENFKSVEKLIYSTVSSFRKKYGVIEKDELISIGFMGFMEADTSYNPEKCAYTTWVRLKIWSKLMDYIVHEQKIKRHREIDKRISCPPNTFIQLLDSLNNDAKNIIDLILDTPDDLQLLINTSNGGSKQIKKTIAKYLGNMGWHNKRIQYAFTQIQKAL